VNQLPMHSPPPSPCPPFPSSSPPLIQPLSSPLLHPSTKVAYPGGGQEEEVMEDTVWIYLLDQNKLCGVCVCVCVSDWGLNSRLHACKVSTLLLEPHLQSILLWLFWRWGSPALFQGWPQTSILPISASQAAGITGVSYLCLARMNLEKGQWGQSGWIVSLVHVIGREAHAEYCPTAQRHGLHNGSHVGHGCIQRCLWGAVLKYSQSTLGIICLCWHVFRRRVWE
jgi:hypothetical protein